MKTRLGYDIGTNSIGWALTKFDDEGNYKEIIDGGVRIIPMNEKQKSEFESGQAITKNAGRRDKRGARRLRHRYLLRRKNLLSFFDLLGIEKEKIQSPSENTPAEEYKIRATATKDRVEIEEFCRILFRLNQRRGYQSNRKERVDSSSSKYLVETKITDLKETGRVLRGKKEFEISLASGEHGTSSDSKLLKLEKEITTEIEVSKSVSKKGEASYSFSVPTEDNWQGRILLMEHELDSSGLTPGQYFYERLKQNQHYKVREKLIYRRFYKREFDLIWEAQEKFYPELRSKELYKNVLEKILPENSPHFKFWYTKSLKEFVRDYIVFYHRPLKTKKSSIGDCPLERGNKVIPFSHPLYQEAKCWAAINNIRLVDDEENRMMLPDSVKETLYSILQKKEKVAKKDVKKLLPTGLNLLRLDMIDDIKGNTTLNKMYKAAKKAGITLEKIIPTREKYKQLWHLLYSVNNAEDVLKSLERNFGLSREQAQYFEKINFKIDRGAYSAKAYRKLLPFLRVGKYWEPIELKPELKENFNLLSEKDKKLLNNSQELAGLPEYLAVFIVYGSYQAINDVKKLESPDQIKLIKRHSLRNPVVEQILNETLQMTRDIWKKHGRPDEIVVELARELKKSAGERKKMTQSLIERSKENEQFRSILQGEFRISNPSRKDLLKYRLWTEQGHECPYSQQKIQKSDLFNGNTDVDHVIPRQRYFDDSFSNKVLTFRSENEAKSNQTAFEYISGKSEASYNSYKGWVQMARISRRKKMLLLAKEIPSDFTKRQLAETRFISRKAIEILEPIASNKAFITSGSITNTIKEQWGLNEVFKRIQLPRFERLARIHEDESWIQFEQRNGRPYLKLKDWNKRIDHRHHALDALVVALTSQAFIQRLANLNRWFEKNPNSDRKTKLKAQFFPLPSPTFREDAENFLKHIIVSHKKIGRLLTKTSNKYLKRNPISGKLEVLRQKGKSYAVRDQLHDELPYGKVKMLRDKPNSIPEALRDLGLVFHNWQKELLESYLENYDGDVGEAIKGLKTNQILTKNGEPLEEVWLYDAYYIKNRKLDQNITKKQLENIPDKKLKAEIDAHLAKYEHKIKKAFSDEGLLEFNSSREIPVFTVRTLVNGDLRQIVKKDGSSDNEKYYVDPSNNYAYLIYEEEGTGKRSYDVVPFIDAVQMKLEQGQLDFSRPGYSCQVLLKGDTVLVPKEESKDNGLFDFQQRYYKLVKMTKEGNRAFFIPVNISSPVFDSEFGSKSYTTCGPSSFDFPPKSIREKCLKVKINRLGEIEKYDH